MNTAMATPMSMPMPANAPMMMPMAMPTGMMNPMMMPMGMMNPMMMPGMNPMMMSGAGMMAPMMCRMTCEMGKEGMMCKVMPMDAAQMETMRERCNALLAMMAAGMPCVMMCGGMMMMCTAG